MFVMFPWFQFAILVKNPRSAIVDIGSTGGLECIMLNSIILAMSSKTWCWTEREPSNNSLLLATLNSGLSSWSISNLFPLKLLSTVASVSIVNIFERIIN